MHDKPAQDLPPDGIRKPAGPLGGLFGDPRTPGDLPPSDGQPRPAPPPPSRNLLTRVVLPLGIFVAAVAIIAWVTQYLPSRPGAPDGGEARVAPADARPLLEPAPGAPGWDPKHRVLEAFWAAYAPPADKRSGQKGTWMVWDLADGKLVSWDGQQRGAPVKVDNPEDRKNWHLYRPEYEVFHEGTRDGGYYDYPLRNVSAGPVEMRLIEASCQCSSLKACVLSEAEWASFARSASQGDPVKRTRNEPADGLTWQPLTRQDTRGLIIPAKANVLVRLYWDGNKQEPERLTLTVKLGSMPVDKPSERHVTGLQAQIAYVRPVMFYPERVEIGTLMPQGVSPKVPLICWSATRDLNVRLADGAADPRLAFDEPEKLPDEELRAFEQAQASTGSVARVRSAYRVRVRVHEQKDNQQLDLGSFQRPVPLTILGNGEPLNVPTPIINGTVMGDIRLGSLEDQNRINLKHFPARLGKTMTVALWAKPGMVLEYEGHHPPILPVEAKLSPKKGETVPEWTVWELKVTVRPNVDPGPLPEDAVLILRAKQPSRLMRIPIVGIAGRG
jgi:hypothetical protein